MSQQGHQHTFHSNDLSELNFEVLGVMKKTGG
jgi:hypothetical protein